MNYATIVLLVEKLLSLAINNVGPPLFNALYSEIVKMGPESFVNVLANASSVFIILVFAWLNKAKKSKDN